MMAMMKTWNNQGFVEKCSKRNDDYTTKNQNNKSTWEKKEEKKTGKIEINTVKVHLRKWSQHMRSS